MMRLMLFLGAMTFFSCSAKDNKHEYNDLTFRLGKMTGKVELLVSLKDKISAADLAAISDSLKSECGGIGRLAGAMELEKPKREKVDGQIERLQKQIEGLKTDEK